MAETSGYPTYSVTTDVVIFTIRAERLEVLLIQRANEPFRGAWALPGGFVDPDEDLEAGARRELEEETGVADVYLEQLHAFGAPGRDPRGRVITVAYYALVPSEALRTEAASDASDVRWFDVADLPVLAFDHAEILAMARRRLRSKLDDSTIAFQFLPERFTLSELQAVYETIRGEELDKRNFRSWALALDAIEETGEVRTGPHRPARLYRLKHPDRVEPIR